MEWRKLYEKYKDVIPYLFFGVCTTLVNIAAYWLCSHPLGMEVVPADIAAWIAAVLFAYLTNRKWVFHSEVREMPGILREMTSFFACRLATGVIDWAMMYVLVDRMRLNDMVIKILANIIVIILNYVASKLLIFRKRPPEGKD